MTINSVVGFALITLVLLGIGGPLVRVAEKMGISPKDYVMINYAVGVIISMLVFGGKGQPLFSSITHTPKGALVAVAATLVLNLSFISIVTAMNLPQGHVSVFYTITSSSVVISSAIGLLFLGELSKVNLSSWFLGAAMILGGVFLVVNSLKH